MTLQEYIIKLTSLDYGTLFSARNGLVVLKQNPGEDTKIIGWNVPNIAQPSEADIAAALLLPSPVDVDALLAYSTIHRTLMATVGVTVNVDSTASTPRSVFASSDTDSLTLLSGTLQYAQLNPAVLIPWVSNGTTVLLNATELSTLAQGVYAYIQSTFAIKSKVSADIAAGAITTNAQIDTAYGSTIGPNGTLLPLPVVTSKAS